MIPEDAVRAAFVAIYDRPHVSGVTISDMRRAFEAAAPHMEGAKAAVQAEALRRAARDLSWLGAQGNTPRAKHRLGWHHCM